MTAVRTVMINLAILSTFFVPACLKRPADKTSALNVSNVDEAGDLWKQFPEVVQIEIKDKMGKTIQLCSGTFVNDLMLVTAAHCMFDGKRNRADHIVFKSEDQIEHKGKIFVNSSYDPRKAERYQITSDMAMVAFDPGQSSKPVAPGTAKFGKGEPLKNNEEIILVGFGDDDLAKNSGAGAKRAGENVVKGNSRDNTFRFWGIAAADGNTKPGTLSSIGSGDSGGAIFRKQDHSFVGIMSQSTGPMKTPREVGIINYAVDLHHKDTLDFYEKTISRICNTQK
ncbi:MAG: trypsin-like serine protease [Oligoflexales bacterium]|nr:trypsin-like serine protease [Oligoflexales bacterium]